MDEFYLVFYDITTTESCLPSIFLAYKYLYPFFIKFPVYKKNNTFLDYERLKLKTLIIIITFNFFDKNNIPRTSCPIENHLSSLDMNIEGLCEWNT